MENASKALLIAAAVLIVIVLIAVGMRILNSSDVSSQVDGQSDSTAMQTFNAQFTGYLGNNISGATLRNLNVVVLNSNLNNPSHQVSFTLPTVASGTIDTVRYEVKAEYDNATGYITRITATGK